MNTPAEPPDKAQDGWMRSATCRAVDAAGRAAGREYGLAESTSAELARLLKRQARRKFGDADAARDAALDGLAKAHARDRLEELGERLVSAPGWAEWLAGVVVPPPAPGLPEYTRDLEIDVDLPSPSIDTHMLVGRKGGGEDILHVRIQKWYQPDLDRHLFQESRKLERKFGKAPQVFVVLMWPPAEGPGMTGHYEEVDARGRVKRVFTYRIRRAWEMTPEEVTQSPGTMLLAPLTRDAKRRMPEIVGMVRDGLRRCRADAKTREMVWAAVYWSMGLNCDLEEAHRALGDLTAFIHQSGAYLSAKGEAFMGAYASALPEGLPAAVRALVLRQGTRRFGPPPAGADMTGAAVAREDLEALADRVMTAADWPSLWAKV